jgi:hypothetical protein
MVKHMVATPDGAQHPTIGFQQFYNFSASHGGYYNYQILGVYHYTKLQKSP